MREIFLYLFSENNSQMTITLFSFWHFFYLALIFGMSIAISLIFINKSAETRKRVVRIFAYLTIGLYIADFLIMPLSDSYNGISTYKLPFNICTLMAVLVPFVEFNKKFEKIKPIVVVLSLASTVMWMCYPGTALGGQPPFSYIIFQTFMYHGFLFNWAVLSISLGKTEMNIKKCWQTFNGILIIFVWAKFGNAVYGKSHNWFFIEESIFPFLSDEIMPLMVIVSVFAVCLLMYGFSYLIKFIYSKVQTKRSTNMHRSYLYFKKVGSN